jgi:hypothetical protein
MQLALESKYIPLDEEKTGLYETLDSSYGRDDKDIITKSLALYQLAQLLKVESLGMAYAILVVAV